MEQNLFITLIAVAFIITGIIYKIVARNVNKEKKEQVDNDN